MSSIENLLKKPVHIVIILAILSLGITAQRFMQGSKTFEGGEELYTNYNNYDILKQSFFHLILDKDLYELYPDEHWDYFKYSPTFALAMAPMAVLPDFAGLFLWTFLNCLIFFFAIWKVPLLNDRSHLFAIGFVLLELITALQNSQSNPMIAGFFILAFILLEKDRTALASLLIVISIFIKLFGVVALALFLFYPKKPKAILYTIMWSALLLLLPLIVITPSQLLAQYQSWLQLLSWDHNVSYGLSVAGWLHTWFGLNISKTLIAVLGALLFCVPLLNIKAYKEQSFRLLLLSSILIWVVIFNHKAESATFILAAAGIAIWFFSQKIKKENMFLVILAFILTILSATDLFPASLRNNYVIPYALKAVPCILIWLKIIYDMLRFEKEAQLSIDN